MSPRARLPRRGRRLGALTLLLVIGLTTVAPAITLLPPDVASAVGRRIPFDGFVDADGHELSAPPGGDARPWIISPMYTRCPTTCSAVTDGLRRAVEQAGLAPSEYRVVSFSFDPDETDDGLRQFRGRMRLPKEWVLLRARDRAALDRTLASLDFRAITIGDGTFEHPNLITVLAPDQRLAGYLFGVSFSPTELAGMVRRASRGVSAVDRWRPYLFLGAVLGFLASATVLAWLLSGRRARTVAV